jgi:hypothetical protein
MTIQRIVEVPLSELQTEKAKSMDITLNGFVQVGF